MGELSPLSFRPQYDCHPGQCWSCQYSQCRTGYHAAHPNRRGSAHSGHQPSHRRRLAAVSQVSDRPWCSSLSWPFQSLTLTLFVHPVTECAPPSTWWATHSAPASWTTCRRRSSLNSTRRKCKCSPRRRSSISSLRPRSSQRRTWWILSNRPSCRPAPPARPNKTTTATFSPSPTPSLTRRPALSDLHPRAPSALPLRAPSAPIHPGPSVPTRRASSTGRSRATAPCPAMRTRYVPPAAGSGSNGTSSMMLSLKRCSLLFVRRKLLSYFRTNHRLCSVKVQSTDPSNLLENSDENRSDRTSSEPLTPTDHPPLTELSVLEIMTRNNFFLSRFPEVQPSVVTFDLSKSYFLCEVTFEPPWSLCCDI